MGLQHYGYRWVVISHVLMCVQSPHTHETALGCCHKHHFWAVLEQRIDTVEAEERTTGAPVALGYDKNTGIVLKAIRTLRHQKPGIGDAKMTKTPCSETLPSSDHVPFIEDGIFSGSSVPVARPISKTPKIQEIPRIVWDGFAEITIPKLDVPPPSPDCTPTPQVPTYPAIPPLQSSNATDDTRQAHGLAMSRRRPLPTSSAIKLSPVVEHKPSTYEPTQSAESVDITRIDKIDVPKQDIYSRTSTMSSAISAKSHEGPGAIYIRPSAQLESMQCISELDKKLRSAARCRNGWETVGRNKERFHTPTGTPESISNIPLNAQVYRAHSRLNSTIQTIPDVTDRVSMQDWAKSSEWIEPCNTTQGSTEWIEDFLTRREQADRAEEEKNNREQKRENGILRVNSLNNFVRKLSGRRKVEERKSFEARQENREELRMPEMARARSWDAITHKTMDRQSTPPPDPSCSKRALSSSPPPRIHAEDRRHTSPEVLYPSPHSHDPVASASTNNTATTTTATTDTASKPHPPLPYSYLQRPLPPLPSLSSSSSSSPSSPSQRPRQQHTQSPTQIPRQTKTLSKPRFRSFSSSKGTRVRRSSSSSLSASRVPAFSERRHGVAGLVGRLSKKIGARFRSLVSLGRLGQGGEEGEEGVRGGEEGVRGSEEGVRGSEGGVRGSEEGRG